MHSRSSSILSSFVALGLVAGCGHSSSASPTEPSGTGGFGAGGSFSNGGEVGSSSGAVANAGGAPSSSNGGAGNAPPQGTSSGGMGGALVGSGGGDNVTFDWPEGSPDGGILKQCRAGKYKGTFTCQLSASTAFQPDGGLQLSITGPVELTLRQSQNGEFLDVSGGSLVGNALVFFQFTSGISGQLDCENGVFNGSLFDGGISIPPFAKNGTVHGPFQATFTTGAPCTGPCLRGNWQLHETTGGLATQSGVCTGTWNATLDPDAGVP
jgi:hypothetical protein